MAVIKEKSSLTVTLIFKDEKKNPIVPTLVTYQIDDVESGTQIKEPTDIVPTSSSYDLEIAWSDNALLSQNNFSETRRITVSFVYGATGKKGNGEFKYLIKNLVKVV